MPPRLSDELVERYLRLLRLLRLSRMSPGLAALKEIVSAHLTRIPFENISKIYRQRQFGLTGLPDTEMYLDGIELFRFGGTCYANNYHLSMLLGALGYEVKLCGADMTNPDVHMVVMARVDGREYLVDVGYGAPFHEPMPRDLKTDYEVNLGRERFVLQPQDVQGRSRW
jgi:N-hydroxyarylamine O-acetyltransferase